MGPPWNTLLVHGNDFSKVANPEGSIFFTNTLNENRPYSPGLFYKVMRYGIDAFPTTGAELLDGGADGFVSYRRILSMVGAVTTTSNMPSPCRMGIPVSSQCLQKIQTSINLNYLGGGGIALFVWPDKIGNPYWDTSMITHWPLWTTEFSSHSYGAKLELIFGKYL